MKPAATLPASRPTAQPEGRFGPYGGRYVPETLVAALDELWAAYRAAIVDKSFLAEVERLNRTFAGRPTPLTEADRLTEHMRRQSQKVEKSTSQQGGGRLGARILLKRE